MSSVRKKLIALAVRPHSLGGWDGLHEPKSIGKDWGVTLPSSFLGDVFDRVLPVLARNPWRPTKNDGVATYLRNADDNDVAEVRAFFEMFETAIAIEDHTSGSFALSRNFAFVDEKPVRTEIGDLVHDAKPYDAAATNAHRKAAHRIAVLMAEFIKENPCLSTVDAVIAVPPSDPDKAYSLPRILAKVIAAERGIDDLTSAVTKLRKTTPLKNLSKAEKAEALLGSIEIDEDAVSGRRILVVDDLYQSGTTLNFVALELLAAGAEEIYGLAAVKTMRNTDNKPAVEDDEGIDDDDDDDDDSE